MAFPLSQGSTPESNEILADQWTELCNEVSVAKITNLYEASGKIVWLTYTRISEPAPADLDVEKWKMPANYAQFENGAGRSNVYAYPIDRDVLIRVET